MNHTVSLNSSVISDLSYAAVILDRNSRDVAASLPYAIAEAALFGLHTLLVLQVIIKTRHSPWKMSALTVMYLLALAHFAALLRMVYMWEFSAYDTQWAIGSCLNDLDRNKDPAHQCSISALWTHQYGVSESLILAHFLFLIINMALSNIWMFCEAWKLWPKLAIRIPSVLIGLTSLVFLGFWGWSMSVQAHVAALPVGLTCLHVTWTTALTSLKLWQRRRELKTDSSGTAIARAAFVLKLTLEAGIVYFLLWTVVLVAQIVVLATRRKVQLTVPFSQFVSVDEYTLWTYLIQLIGIYHAAVLLFAAGAQEARQDGFRKLVDTRPLDLAPLAAHDSSAADSDQRYYDDYQPSRHSHNV